MATTCQTPGFDDDSPSMLSIVLTALRVKGRIPRRRPTSELPAYFNRDNILDFYLERKPGGWVANIAFSNVPVGQPDVIGTAEAFPLKERDDAFLAGAAIVCKLVTGSGELPFFLFKDKLICVV